MSSYTSQWFHLWPRMQLEGSLRLAHSHFPPFCFKGNWSSLPKLPAVAPLCEENMDVH